MKHFILILLSLGFGATEAAPQAAPLPPQQHLQKLLDDIKQLRQQKGEQTAAIKQLEQQLACHWTLIRSYQTCDQLHAKQPSEQLRCARHAKANADSCLSKLVPNSEPADFDGKAKISEP